MKGICEGLSRMRWKLSRTVLRGGVTGNGYSLLDSGKAPYYTTTKDASPFSFAGIWESWRAPDGTTIETCAILTTSANSLMALIHDRMPVILQQSEFARWLDPAYKDILHLQNFYHPFPLELMTSWPVAKTVNSPANDLEECIRPLEPSLFE